jgi:hypothetical protein
MKPSALTLISLPLNALFTITVSIADEGEMPKTRGRASDRSRVLRERNLHNLHGMRLRKEKRTDYGRNCVEIEQVLCHAQG